MDASAVIPYVAGTLVDGTCIESLPGVIESKTVSKNNRSGIRGNCKYKRTDRWCAQIAFKGKIKFLGSYDTLREAQAAGERGEEIFEEFSASYDAGKNFRGCQIYGKLFTGNIATAGFEAHLT